MIQVNFIDPKLISKDFIEVLDVSLDFSDFEPTFKTNFQVIIPKQKVVKAKKQTSYDITIDPVESSTVVAGGVGVATTVIMGGAMQQVWGLINGL